MGFYMSLAEAVSIVASQPAKFRSELFSIMVSGSKADGLCSRPEALLLMAVSSAWGLSPHGKGRVYSFEAKGVPLHRDQIIYVSKEDRNDRSLLADSEVYEDINNIARLSGFELVYVPRIARHFETYQKTDILKKVLTLVRPTLDRSEDELIRQLRAMTPYKFFTNILERRLKLSFDLDEPSWLIKLGGSQVGGTEYANFLLLEMDFNHMKRQLKGFMSEFLRYQPEHIVSVSSVEEDADNFRYGGFIKSILDMISLGTEDRWDVIIRETVKSRRHPSPSAAGKRSGRSSDQTGTPPSMRLSSVARRKTPTGSCCIRTWAKNAQRSSDTGRYTAR